MQISSVTGRRVAPVEFRDAVEEFARKSGTHGDILWVGPPISAWQVRLTLKPGDPRLRSDHPDDKYESVLLVEWVDPQKEPTNPLTKKLHRRDRWNRLLPAYVSVELDDLGVQGVLDILEKGSLMTGRGEFKSAEEAVKKTREANQSAKDIARRKARIEAGARARDVRRQLQKIPFHRVGIDLTQTE